MSQSVRKASWHSVSVGVICAFSTIGHAGAQELKPDVLRLKGEIAAPTGPAIRNPQRATPNVARDPQWEPDVDAALGADDLGAEAAPAAQTTQASDQALTESQAKAAYEQALDALKLQQWTQAELLLERVLMFQPEHAEALLRLATLLAQRDRLESAQALISMLLNDPRTPTAHRNRLQLLLDNSAADPTSALADSGASDATVRSESNTVDATAARTQALFSLGYTRNPLGTTSASQLTLTLPDGLVILPVITQAEGGRIGTVALHHQQPSGLELYAQLQTSSLSQASTSGRVAVGGPLGLKNYSWSFSSQRALDASTRHSAAVVRALEGNTQVMASVFHESSYKRTDWLVRAQRSVTVAGRWPVTGWGEYEHGRGVAPGAVRGGVQALFPLAPSWQLQSLVYGQWDTSGYNKLLKNNAPRKLLTAHIELEYRWPAPQIGGQATLSAYVARRWSNLTLFDWSDHGVRLSWLRQW